MEPAETTGATLTPTNDILGGGDAVSILDIGAENDRTVDVTEQGQGRGGIGGLYQRLNEKVQALGGIKLKDKVTFFELLGVMIDAGIPITKALYALSGQIKNARLRKIIATMGQKVESGKTFSDSMEDFLGVFTEAQVGMVRAGESSGKLNDVLRQIAVQTSKSEQLQSKVKGAMIYPAVVFTMMGGAVVVILAFVVPKIMELFTQTNSELPTSTKILLSLSDLVRNNYVMVGAGLAGLVLFVSIWKKTPSGRYHVHQLLLRLPVFGTLMRYVAISRFTRTLSSLMDSGIPIVKSLQINADAVGNEVYKRRIQLAAEDVSRGIPLAENLTDSQFLFPDMVVSMVAIGEQTAELSKVSGKIADYFEDKVDQMTANMSKLLEPIIMAVMGIVVGGLIVAVMQPIFSLMDVVGNV